MKELFPRLKVNKKSAMVVCYDFSKAFPAQIYGTLFAAAYHANMWLEAAELKHISLSGESRHLGFKSV